VITRTHNAVQVGKGTLRRVSGLGARAYSRVRREYVTVRYACNTRVRGKYVITRVGISRRARVCACNANVVLVVFFPSHVSTTAAYSEGCLVAIRRREGSLSPRGKAPRPTLVPKTFDRAAAGVSSFAISCPRLARTYQPIAIRARVSATYVTRSRPDGRSHDDARAPQVHVVYTWPREPCRTGRTTDDKRCSQCPYERTSIAVPTHERFGIQLYFIRLDELSRLRSRLRFFFVFSNPVQRLHIRDLSWTFRVLVRGPFVFVWRCVPFSWPFIALCIIRTSASGTRVRPRLTAFTNTSVVENRPRRLRCALKTRRKRYSSNIGFRRRHGFANHCTCIHARTVRTAAARQSFVRPARREEWPHEYAYISADDQNPGRRVPRSPIGRAGRRAKARAKWSAVVGRRRRRRRDRGYGTNTKGRRAGRSGRAVCVCAARHPRDSFLVYTGGGGGGDRAAAI